MYIDVRLPPDMRELIRQLNDVDARDHDNTHSIADRISEMARSAADPFLLATADVARGIACLNHHQFTEGLSCVEYIASAFSVRGENMLCADALNIAGACYAGLNNREEAFRALRCSLEYNDSGEYNTTVGSAMISIAQLHLEVDAYDEAIHTIDRMQTMIDQATKNHHDDDVVVHGLILLAGLRFGIHLGLHEFDPALECALSGYHLALRHDLKPWAAFYAAQIGCVYINVYDNERSIEWYTLSGEHAEACDDLRMKMLSLKGLASNYCQLERYQEALGLIEQIERSFSDVCHLSDRSNLLIIKVRAVTRMHHESAPDIIQSALKLAQEIDSIAMQISILEDIVSFYRSIGDNVSALTHLESYLQHIERLDQQIRGGIETMRTLEEIKQLQRLKDDISDRISLNKQLLSSQQHEIAYTYEQVKSQADVLSLLRTGLHEVLRHEHDAHVALQLVKEQLAVTSHDEIDWSRFEASFIEAHPTFRSVLRERYPTLSAQELRICQLVRLGLKNLDIAHLLSLSERSIENYRLQVRKKLRLPTDKKLAQFLTEIQ